MSQQSSVALRTQPPLLLPPPARHFDGKQAARINQLNYEFTQHKQVRTKQWKHSQQRLRPRSNRPVCNALVKPPVSSFAKTEATTATTTPSNPPVLTSSSSSSSDALLPKWRSRPAKATVNSAGGEDHWLRPPTQSTSVTPVYMCLVRCNTEMVKRVNPETKELKYNCPSCDAWSETVFCNDVYCQEQECVANATTGRYHCPVCNKRYGLVETKYIEQKSLPPAMPNDAVSRVLRCLVRPRCKNAACGPDTIVEDRKEAVGSCSKCGLVFSDRHTEDEAARNFDDKEDADSAIVATGNFNNLASEYVEYMAGNETEKALLRDRRRMHRQFSHVWNHSMMGTNPPRQLVEEVVSLLVLYIECSGDKLRQSGNTAPVHAAALFIATRNSIDMQLRFSPYTIITKFMSGMQFRRRREEQTETDSSVTKAKLANTPTEYDGDDAITYSGDETESDGEPDTDSHHASSSSSSSSSSNSVSHKYDVLGVSMRVRFNMFADKLKAMKKSLGDRMPAQYTDTVDEVSLFWLITSDILRIKGAESDFPLEKHDIDAVMATLAKLQDNTETRLMAHNNTPFSIAGFVYSHALNGRSKIVNGICVRMTVELAKKIMQVSTATLSDLRAKFGPLLN